MTSAVYRQSSRRPGVDQPSLDESVDPANDLLGRRSLRRLEAEAMRDAVLAASGGLNRRLGGPPTPLVSRPDGLVMVASTDAAAARRRSVYLFARRNYPVGLLDVFDFPIMALNCTRRPTTATPLQSLAALNSEFVQDQAVAMAARVRTETSVSAPHAVQVRARLPAGIRASAVAARIEALRRFAQAPGRGLPRRESIAGAGVESGPSRVCAICSVRERISLHRVSPVEIPHS